MGKHHRTLPLETLSLPYACGDPGCRCAGPPEEDGLTVEVRPDGRGWRAAVRDDSGMTVDVFRSHTINEALEAVHREYPWARFDPEE